MTKKLLTIIVILLFVVNVKSSIAMECGTVMYTLDNGEICFSSGDRNNLKSFSCEARASDIVFHGRTISISDDTHEAVFYIIKAWKGVTAGGQIIINTTGSIFDDYEYFSNGEYLIFANHNVELNKTEIDICSLSHIINTDTKYSKEIELLDNLKKEDNQTNNTISLYNVKNIIIAISLFVLVVVAFLVINYIYKKKRQKKMDL